MKRIVNYKKLFQVEQELDLAQLKKTYRQLVKTWHPDKFQEGDPLKLEAERKSTEIIDAYHFLVSIAPETIEQNLPNYNQLISSSIVADFDYKGSTLKVTFHTGDVYEYFAVQPNIFKKFAASPSPERFGRRHVFSSHVYRQLTKSSDAEDLN